MSATVGPEAGARPRRTVAELCDAAELGEEAVALSLQGTPPRELMRQLIDAGLFTDAVRFLAHALPGREGVWWTWVCARKAAGEAPPPPIRAALAATERWIAQPTDEHRRAAMAAAETADYGTAAGCAGLAAFLSTGSLAPPDAPVVAPGEFMAAKAVAGGVTLAVLATEPEKAEEKFRAYLALGLEVAERTRLWA
jgi:hypothetical protein